MDISFIGLGYIGLPTAVSMANSGVKVTGVDIDERVIESINGEKGSYSEPGLNQALRNAIRSGNFIAQKDYVSADVHIIAVPTPFLSNHKVDLRYINSALDGISPHLKGGDLIVLESTSPPLTTRGLIDKVRANRPDLMPDGFENPDDLPTIYFAYCPERILPGNALTELAHNDRIIGGDTEKATQLAIEVYRTFCKGSLLPTTALVAEMAKLTENSFRDVNIAFANEISLVCDKIGVDVWELISLANRHPRVNILEPGPGVGGHCIAVDPWFLVSTDMNNTRLIRTAREINDSKPHWVIKKIEDTIQETDVLNIALLGLSFKANIDDLRESPAMFISEELAGRFLDINFRIVEPNIELLPPSLGCRSNVTLSDLDTAVEASELIVVLVDHADFLNVSSTRLFRKKVIDTKGIWKITP